MEAKDLEEILKTIEEEVKKQAVLLYTTTDYKDEIMAKCAYAVYIDESVSHSMLRSLDEVVEERFKFLLADSPDIALRGLDFRSRNNSILFATTRSFTHQREMVQAASRLGR